jgi:hypothetical protein
MKKPAKKPQVSQSVCLKVAENKPGPGAYYTSLSLADQIKTKTFGKNGVFGNTERRFVSQTVTNTPGPGYYDTEKTEETKA